MKCAKIKYHIILILVGLIIFNIININLVFADTKELYSIADATTDTTEEEKTSMDWKDGFKAGDDFIQRGANSETEILTSIDENQLRKDASGIYNVLLSIGTALTVIVGVILGIQFMMASAEDKAKVKEMMIPYVVGCVVIFGAFGIWKVTVEIGDKINSSSQQEYDEGKVDYTRQKNSEKIENIEQGKKEVSELSDDEIKSLYRSNSIDSDLNEKVNGARNKNKKSLSQAISELSSAKKKIYQEAKSRNLLKKDAAGNEIWLK